MVCWYIFEFCGGLGGAGICVSQLTGIVNMGVQNGVIHIFHCCWKLKTGSRSRMGVLFVSALLATLEEFMSFKFQM